MDKAANDEARSYGRTAGLLTLGLGMAGILGYLFSAVASHELPENDYGLIVVLWSIAFLATSVLFRPVEHLLAQTVAELEERGLSITHATKVAAVIQVCLAGAFTLLLLTFRSSIEQELFDGDDLYFWVLLATVLSFAASYFARGYFAGSHRMGWYATLLVVEGVVRLALSLVAAVGMAEGAALMTIAVAAAPIASLMVIPVALSRGGRAKKPHLGVPNDGMPAFTLARGGGFAASVLVIMLCEQILINGGVLFVRAAEDAAAAGFIFNVLMVARAPVVLFQAIAASLLPHLTRLRSRGNQSSDEAFALSVRLTLQVIGFFTAAVLIGLLAVGPTAMQIAFGDNFEYARTDLMIVGVGMGLFLAAGTLNQATLAQGQARRAAMCWVFSAAVFVLINVATNLTPYRAVELGFTASASVLLVGLLVLFRHPSAVPRDEVPSGSGREVELQLAAADEAV
jgi:O-antigen/teichoic acid export membrane protein